MKTAQFSTNIPDLTLRLLTVGLFLMLGTIVSAYGQGDSLATATPISIGSSVSGAIDFGGNLDYFSVQISSSGTFTAYTTGSTDTFGDLFNSGGSTVAYNDDDPYPNFRISALVSAGTYYVRVRHYSTGGTGNYTLYTEFTSSGGGGSGGGGSGDDHGNTTGTASVVSANSSVSGTIDYNGDIDFFQLQLSSSGTLSVSTSGYTDTYGYLWDSGGSTLIYNDDNPFPNFGFTISLNPGTYYVKVRHYSTGTGAYTLSTSFSGSGSGGGGGGGPASLNESLDNTGLSWSTSGNGSWYGQTGTYYSGGDAAQSPWLNHNQYTTLETTVTGPGALSFYWRVSSESCCDPVRFYIDGMQQNQISGETGWTYQSYNLASGSHSLRWTYSTDGSILTGSNAGWVDNVQFTPSAAPPPPPSTMSDLIWRHRNAGLNAVWFMNGVNRTESQPILPDIVADLDWEIVGAGDFNSDGQSDLVWQHRTLGFIGIWFMDGRAMSSTALANPSQASDLGWRIVGVADFNIDGHPDLLWQHDTSGQVAIWHMDGVNLASATLTTPSTPSPQNWKLMGAGDFNSDGYPDFLWEHPTWGNVAIWYMNDALYTGMAYTSPYSYVSDINWKAAGLGDFNQDGHIDIAWQHDLYGMISAWLMNNYLIISFPSFNPSTPDNVDWKLQGVGEIQPSPVDSDSDLMPDAWETLYFGTLNQAGYGDYDGDGVNNLQEYRTENDPTAPNLTLKISRPRNGTNIP